MKLVTILAREMEEWPVGDSVKSMSQDADCLVSHYTGTRQRYSDSGRGWGVPIQDYILNSRFEVSEMATDYKTAIVTRADWEAERARIAKPAKKADKDGWIRHRGGKCPVDAGVLVEVKLRDGGMFVHEGGNLRWGRAGNYSDIMRYRIVKPADQPVIEPMVAANVQAFCPLEARDRIREIDTTTRALEVERVSLIQRLAGEGFRLLQDKVCGSVQSVEDWQVSAVSEGKFIQAIKEYRNLHGSGLKEAKLAVENYRDAYRPSA